MILSKRVFPPKQRALKYSSHASAKALFITDWRAVTSRWWLQRPLSVEVSHRRQYDAFALRSVLNFDCKITSNITSGDWKTTDVLHAACMISVLIFMFCIRLTLRCINLHLPATCSFEVGPCWKHSSEVLVHIDMITSRSCCRCVGFTSMMQISLVPKVLN